MLSELRELHVPVIATRVGSFAERIEDGVNGWLIDPEPASFVKKAAWLRENRQLLTEMRETLAKGAKRNAAEMVADYEQLLAPAENVEAQLVTAYPDQGQSAALASVNADKQREIEGLEGRLKESRIEIRERTHWAKERDRALESEKKENAIWVGQLEQDIQEQIDAHQNTLDVLDQARDAHREQWGGHENLNKDK